MRILQVSLNYYPEMQFGGQPQKIRALSLGLVERGHQVEVATLHSERPQARGAVDMEGVRVHYLPWAGREPWRVPHRLRDLRRLVARADIVHLYGLYNLLCPAAALLSLQLRRPYFLEPLGMYAPRARKMRAKVLYHRLFTSWMANGAARVVATSPLEARELEGLGAPGQLVMRRDGVDLSDFQTLAADNVSGDAFRSRHGIGAHERVVLYVGRISPIKNLDSLILAFGQAKVPHARLVLVGPTLEAGYEALLRRLIEAHGLLSCVLLTGPLYDEHKRQALDAADLFVLPSLSESFGIAAAEAVAAGVPVLLTEGCGIAPLIDGRAGLAVACDAMSLSHGMSKMLDNAAGGSWTRRRDEVLKELSWEEPLEVTERMYQGVAREHQRLRPGLTVRD